MRIFLLCLLFAGCSIVTNAQRSFDIHFNSTQPSLLVASTGDESTIAGTNLILGGNPSGFGGTEPYTYQWNPAENLDNPSIANPLFTGSLSASYTLLITDSRGCLASDTIQIIITGLNNSQEDAAKIYPNPSSGSILIEAPKQLHLKNTTVQLIDGAGRAVYTGAWIGLNQTYLLDVSKLAKGHYSILLKDRESTITNKIIIQ